LTSNIQAKSRRSCCRCSSLHPGAIALVEVEAWIVVEVVSAP